MSATEQAQVFPCDLCGSDDAEEIAVSRKYTGGQPIHVCKNCGFVYVRSRRSADRIGEAWSKEIFQKGYTARIPAVKARQVYVADFADVSLNLKGKTVCDIGAGEGQFLDIARDYGAEVFGIEPSDYNCKLLGDLGIEHFKGTIEEYLASPTASARKFDVVTVMWTLENCQSCRRMLEAAHDLLKPGGSIVVATGSRLLVPFKKPLHMYLSKNPSDTHSFRFSANTLRGLLAVSGFEPADTNRFIDTDYLVTVGKKADKNASIAWQKDDWRAVQDFFDRWDRETQAHFAEA